MVDRLQNANEAHFAECRGKTAATPIWFGDAAAPRFGWFHGPSKAAPRAGVVLCPPFGHEMLVSYQSLRLLAEHLADLGFAVLRFDYGGTGDSFGNLSDDGIVANWPLDVVLAADTLRKRAKVADIALFGLRLGATIALSAAAAAGANTVAMLAPYRTGREFIRELRAQAKLEDTKVGCADPGRHALLKGVHNNAAASDDLDVFGYQLTATAQKAILGFTPPATAPTRRYDLMIIPRDDLPHHTERLVDELRQHGMLVDTAACPGYMQMMRSETYEACTPTFMWSKIGRWLLAKFPNACDAHQSPMGVVLEKPVDHAPNINTWAPASCNGIQEQSFMIDGIFAILTSPAVPQDQFPGSLVIIPNTGANHRVGNHGLNVALARDVAARGTAVLRFDRRNVGDSLTAPPHQSDTEYSRTGIDDLRTVMDAMNSALGFSTFNIIGICSGAYFGYLLARMDPRISGLLLVNNMAFTQIRDRDLLKIRTERTRSTSYYLREVKSAAWIGRLLRGQVNIRLLARNFGVRLMRYLGITSARLLERTTGFRTPLIEAEIDMMAILARGCRVHLIYSDCDPGLNDFNEQLGGNTGRIAKSDHFRLTVLPGAGHTLTARWAQRWLLSAARGFARQGPAVADPETLAEG